MTDISNQISAGSSNTSSFSPKKTKILLGSFTITSTTIGDEPKMGDPLNHQALQNV